VRSYRIAPIGWLSAGGRFPSLLLRGAKTFHHNRCCSFGSGCCFKGQRRRKETSSVGNILGRTPSLQLFWHLTSSLKFFRAFFLTSFMQGVPTLSVSTPFIDLHIIMQQLGWYVDLGKFIGGRVNGCVAKVVSRPGIDSGLPLPAEQEHASFRRSHLVGRNWPPRTASSTMAVQPTSWMAQGTRPGSSHRTRLRMKRDHFLLLFLFFQSSVFLHTSITLTTFC